MFFENPDYVFKLLGVFYVERADRKPVVSTGRQHVAIAYRVQGEGTFCYGNTTVTAPTGSVIYIPAGLDYRRHSTPETMIVLHLQGVEPTGHHIEVIDHMEQIEPLFRKLLAVWESKESGTYNRSMQLLYGIFEFLQNANNSSLGSVPTILRPGLALLHAHYRDPGLRISQLADACFVSEVYFRKIFHQHFGESPQNALLSMRFRYACELLDSGYYTQKEAAFMAGFSDVKYFRTAFKRRFGITPGEYVAHAPRGCVLADGDEAKAVTSGTYTMKRTD